MASPRPEAPYRATIRQRALDLKEVRDCLRALDDDAPDALSRALARYLTVRSVGYVEAVRDDLADLYAFVTGHHRLHRRVSYHLRSGLGASPEQLLTFVGSFDNDWRIALEAVLDADDATIRNQLGAMVAARKKIAHGDGEQVTSGKALGWSAVALELGNELSRLFDPAGPASQLAQEW